MLRKLIFCATHIVLAYAYSVFKYILGYCAYAFGIAYAIVLFFLTYSLTATHIMFATQRLTNFYLINPYI